MNRSVTRLVLCSAFLYAALAALVAPNARADDTADEAEVQFELGAKQYAQGDYLGALEHFLTSNRLVPNKNVLYNIARCYEQLHRYPDAYRAYGRALEIETNADRKKDLETALARIAPKIAVLEIVTDPPGATVYLDRKDLGPRGATPRKLGVEKKKYKVIVELPGYESATSAEIDPELGAVTKVRLKLEPILATMEVIGDDTGATVRLDDATAPLCTIPCTVRVAPGHHVVHVSREGHKTADIPVDLAPKQKTTVKPALDVLTGTVVVNSDVRDALIEVDGKPFGFTPAVVQVPVGQHVMTISRSGFKAVQQKITVSMGSQARIDATLTEVSEVTAASRTEESVEEAPSSVSIIPSVELRGMGYPTIAEAVRGVRGVYLSDDRHYVTVGFRGFSRLGDYGNRVLVLVDGHPANDNYIGSSFTGFDARSDIDDVERIEVIRGPGSVLYGTGAFFGVINLVTRSRGAPTRVDGGVSTVQDSVARARVSANVRLGPDSGVWTSFAGARGFGRDFFFPELATPALPDGHVRGLDTFEAGTTSGRAWWKSLTVQWFFNERKKVLPTAAFETILGDARTTFRDRRAFVEARYEPQVSESFQSFSRAHANLYDFRGTYAYEPVDGGLTVDRYTGYWAGLEQRFAVASGKLLRVTFGGELIRHFRTQQTGFDETQTTLSRNDPYVVSAGYLLADVAPSPRFKTSAGVRLDWYSTFGASLNPRLAFIGRPWADGIVKLLGGKAFRAPSVYELYYSSTTQRASTDLKPEDVYSGELEVSHRFSSTVVATSSLWTNYVANIITLRGGGSSTDPSFYTNANKPVLTNGVDLEVRRDFRDGWMLAAHGTFQRARYLENSDGALREVPNSPEWLASIRGAVPVIARALFFSSRVTFVGPRWDRYELAGDPTQERTDPALLWDFVFTGEAERSGIRYGIGVYNAFDWRWSTPASVEFRQRSILQNGRTLFASLSLAL